MTQSKVERTEYLDYLEGTSKLDSVELIDYGDVILNLKDYFLHDRLFVSILMCIYEPIFQPYFEIGRTLLIGERESFEFTIYELEFFEGLNSKNNRCGNDLLSYDDEVVKKFISLKGCRAPYLNEYASFPLCNTSNGIRFAKLTYGKIKIVEYDRPC